MYLEVYQSFKKIDGCSVLNLRLALHVNIFTVWVSGENLFADSPYTAQSGEFSCPVAAPATKLSPRQRTVASSLIV